MSRHGQGGHADRPGPGAGRGFSLVETLVAAAVALCLLAALLGAAAQAQRTAILQPEAADMEQRLRTGVSALTAQIERAGAGTPLGCAPGPLHRYIAPILPYRIGLRGAQPPGTFDPQTVSVISVPADARVAMLAAPLAAPAATAAIGPTIGSYAGSPSFGFTEGMSVAVIDDDGFADVFRVVAVAPGALSLELMAAALNGVHPAGACVVEVEVASYTLAPDAATGSTALTRYDGYLSELPVIDHVVDLTLTYHGESRAPTLMRDTSEPSGPWTTYGLRPPPTGTDNPRDSWPAGENCLFAAGGPLQPPRLPNLGAAGGDLVALDGPLLTDGPWCPDAGRPSAFDADLLRIRRISVTLRVETPVSFLRGPIGPLFARGGSSAGGMLFLPDRAITIDITPRNLGADR